MRGTVEANEADGMPIEVVATAVEPTIA